MTTLEKILQEIEEKAVCKGNQENGFVLMKYVREIFRKYLNAAPVYEIEETSVESVSKQFLEECKKTAEKYKKRNTEFLNVEKVLYEIEQECFKCRKDCSNEKDVIQIALRKTEYNTLKHVEEIIKKHISENKGQNKCGDCSRRKFYQIGYRDGKKDNDWIPCSERMPDKGEKVLCYFKYEPESPDVMCDNVYIGSGIWQSETDKVVAWMKRPVEYKPPVESADSKRMREREEFFSGNDFLTKRFMEMR